MITIETKVPVREQKTPSGEVTSAEVGLPQAEILGIKLDDGVAAVRIGDKLFVRPGCRASVGQLEQEWKTGKFHGWQDENDRLASGLKCEHGEAPGQCLFCAFAPDPAPVWKAICPKCGRVDIAQKSKPKSCKNTVKRGPRSFRFCRCPLTILGKFKS